MGNFSSRQNKVDNARERDHQRRDRLFTDGGGEANLSVIITGLVLTVLSAMLANKILE